MNKIPNYILIISSAVLLWLGFPPFGFTGSIFLGIIPLLELEKRYEHGKGWRFFGALYLSLLLWNILATWWVMNSTIPGAIVMLVLNSLFMCVPWLLYRKAKHKIGDPAQYLLVVFWLLYEYLHHRWDLSWPWLTLGNGLANAPWLIQWYDITGTLGGTAVVLAINVLLWKAIAQKSKQYLLAASAVFVFVLASSLFNQWKFEKWAEKPVQTIQTVALQPSFDPWNEKFDRHPSDLLQEMIDLSLPSIDSSTELLVWPETSLVDGIDVQNRKTDYQVQQLQMLRLKYPKLTVLTGADMQEIYRDQKEKPNSTARKTSIPGTYWNAYNSALLVGKDSISFYHKSKLVPGTEQMPFTQYLPFLEKMAISLDENSISGSLGKSDTPVVLQSGNMKIAPAVCYESIYGDYVGQFVRKGANLIAVITNDAWWGKTPGYRQHLAFGSLRAIEHRRWVVRSANTGTTCFISPTGQIQQATDWWKKTSIRQKVELLNRKTIYTRQGDLPILIGISGICLLLAFLYYRKIHSSTPTNQKV